MLKNKGVFFVAAAAFLIDRVTKICVIQLVKPVSRMPVIDGILSFPYLENKGAAFSVLTQHPLFLKLFAIATVIIISAYFLLSKREFLFKYKLAWGFVLGGSLGNLFDRLSFGYVIDFISLDFVRFAVFNFADIFINVGVLLLIISILLEYGKKECPICKK